MIYKTQMALVVHIYCWLSNINILFSVTMQTIFKEFYAKSSFFLNRPIVHLFEILTKLKKQADAEAVPSSSLIKVEVEVGVEVGVEVRFEVR